MVGRHRDRGQTRFTSPLTMLSTNPWTLVCPEFQNTAAIEKRAMKAMKPFGIRSNRPMTEVTSRASDEEPAGAAARTLEVAVLMTDVSAEGGSP